jgi:CDP-paratose 2-epimerase
VSAPILITGGAGFIGSNLADRLASDGRDVLILDSLERPGVERNLAWLQQRHPHRVAKIIADIRDRDAVARAVREASTAFHFAAQVAVTSSLVDPRLDCEVNILGTLNLIEAIRERVDPIPLIFASTNKVYGDLADIPMRQTPSGHLPTQAAVRQHGIAEDRPLDFHTPYGVSKGSADQYVLDAARSFGIPSAVVRMSCIYGQRQMGTEDQGWVAHFLIQALKGAQITVYGDGHQVRDVLDVSDAVRAYLALLGSIDHLKGRAFNLGGGPANAISLRTLLSFIGELLGREVAVTNHDWRAGDQRYFVADAREIIGALGLPPRTPWRVGVQRLAQWLKDESGTGASATAVSPDRLAVAAS